MLNDFAVGPLVRDLTSSALDAKPAGGSAPIRFVASMTVFPSIPSAAASASASEPPGTAISTASASETSPPSRPRRVTSCPACSQRSASPPPTLPLPITAIFIFAPDARRSSPLPRRAAYHEAERAREQVVRDGFWVGELLACDAVGERVDD